MWHNLNSNQYHQEEEEKPKYLIKRKIKLKSKESGIERVKLIAIKLRNNRKGIGQKNL